MTAIRKLADNYTEADIDDEIILMRLDNGELMSLAGSGAAIWRLIDGERDRRSLIAALQSQFDAGTDEIAHDVDGLLGQLREAGLIAD